MEKYGFVYIWMDSRKSSQKRYNEKMYYVGSHWGTENDGYICSSNAMRDAYRRRPQDFKRRILKSGIQDRRETYNEEQRWFNMMKKEELGIRYYNKCLGAGVHWSAYKEPIPWNKGLTKEDDERVKAPKTAFKKGQAAWNKGKSFDHLTEEEKQQRFGAHNIGRILSKETQKKMADTRKQRGVKPGVKKGNTPWNKGKKGSQMAWNKGQKRTWESSGDFQKGNIPWNKGL